MGAKPHSILALSLPQLIMNGLKDSVREFMTAVINLALLLLAEIRLKALISPLLLRPWAGCGQAVLRSGAKVGDYVCVSGQVGDAAYGLQHLGHPLQKD